MLFPKMTKYLMAGALITSIGLIGCGGNNEATTDEPPMTSTVEEPPSAVSQGIAEGLEKEGEEATAGMPNPWVVTESADEAAKGAGLTSSFVVPAQIPCGEVTYDAPIFDYMKDIAQATYEKSDSKIVIRKGKVLGIGLSGDYTNYKVDWDLNPSESLTITCHGYEKGKVVAAEWSNGENGNDKFYLLAQNYNEEDMFLTEDQIVKLVTDEIK